MAQTCTWVGGTDTDMDKDANWTGTVSNVKPTGADNATIAAATPNQPRLGTCAAKNVTVTLASWGTVTSAKFTGGDGGGAFTCTKTIPANVEIGNSALDPKFASVTISTSTGKFTGGTCHPPVVSTSTAAAFIVAGTFSSTVSATGAASGISAGTFKGLVTITNTGATAILGGTFEQGFVFDNTDAGSSVDLESCDIRVLLVASKTVLSLGMWPTIPTNVHTTEDYDEVVSKKDKIATGTTILGISGTEPAASGGGGGGMNLGI